MAKFSAYAEGSKGGKDEIFDTLEDAQEWAKDRIEYGGYQWVEISKETADGPVVVETVK